MTELPDNETLAGKGPIAAKDRKIMKAWVVTELGDPDQMIWTEMEEPKTWSGSGRDRGCRIGPEFS